MENYLLCPFTKKRRISSASFLSYCYGLFANRCFSEIDKILICFIKCKCKINIPILCSIRIMAILTLTFKPYTNSKISMTIVTCSCRRRNCYSNIRLTRSKSISRLHKTCSNSCLCSCATYCFSCFII